MLHNRQDPPRKALARPQAPPDPADVALREALDRRDAAFQNYLARNPGADPAAGPALATEVDSGDPAPGGGRAARWESDAELAARLNAADAALLAALNAHGRLAAGGARTPAELDPNRVSGRSAAPTAGASAAGQGGSVTLRGPDRDPDPGPTEGPARGAETDTELAARLNALDRAFVAALSARDAGAGGPAS